MFSDDDLTRDGFLGGQCQLLQPKTGYRAATDPVFLAASVPAKPVQSVLELGCGAGAALYCLASRVSGLTLVGVERQAAYSDLARRNARENAVEAQIYTADLCDLPVELTAQSFDHVIANPPYLTAGAGTRASDAGREQAFREETPLADWMDTAIRRLKPGGILSVVHLAERVPSLLSCLDARVGAIAVKPIAARSDRPARRVILQARKGAKGPFALHAPLIVHQGDTHEQDGENFTDAARAILRDGQALSF